MKKDLKDLIEMRTIPLRQFEKEIGVSRQTISNIMTGKTAASFLTVKKICNYFNVDYKEYL